MPNCASTSRGAVPASIEEVEKLLHVGADGLTSEHVERTRERAGYNELPVQESHLLLKLASYFWGPIPWMIEAAVALSLAARHWADLAIISSLLFINAAVGFWEEYQAGNAIAALRGRLALQARVRRDGAWAPIPARELVPGDLVRVRLGDIVPADAMVATDADVEADESALTGESLPVSHRLNGMLYSGSIVRRGEADALVYATGAGTFFGKTAELVASAHSVSHFQRAVLRVGNYLIALDGVMVALILAAAFIRDNNFTTTLEFALVLTVAAIPVAMPVVLTVTMAVGARTLAVREAIVSRLAAIEELAGMDILCTDKTGTLTMNHLSLGEPFAASGVTSDEVIHAAVLCSRREDTDPIDDAILASASAEEATVLAFQPFDPVHKRTEATVADGSGGQFRVTKGAPQVILALSADAAVTAAADAAIDGFARRGYRSLGVARTLPDGSWRFLGILPLYDPPRTDSAETIVAARAMGVDVKMVTGDQLPIAREIAFQVGLKSNIVDATEIPEADGESPESDALIERTEGFAQVYPEHKFRIVQALQRRGHIVGMTGDGVNDAPALKQADAGIAVSGATDAARDAADIVLLSAGLSVIIDAIRESRRIFRRMNSYAIYRIAETIRVLLFMTASILVFDFFPVTAVMIVLIALLNDGAILSIAYDRAAPRDRPERWDMRSVLAVATVLGAIGVVASFTLFALGDKVFELDRDKLQTLMYLKLSVAGHLTIFVTRTRGPFWSSRPSRILLVAVLATQALATVIAVYGILMTPLGWGWAAFVWGYALAWFLLNDRIKMAAYWAIDRIRGRRGPQPVEPAAAPA